MCRLLGRAGQGPADRPARRPPAVPPADIGSLRRAASPRANSDAMPCDSDQTCSATIRAGGRWLAGRRGDQRLRALAQHREGAVAGLLQFGVDIDAARRPRTSPSNRPGWVAGEREIGFADSLERLANGSGLPSSQAALSASSNSTKPRCATSASNSSRSRKCRYGAAGLTPAARAASAKVKPARALLGDQRQRGPDQRLAQVAVVIAARAFAAVSGPIHVDKPHSKA